MLVSFGILICRHIYFELIHKHMLTANHCIPCADKDWLSQQRRAVVHQHIRCCVQQSEAVMDIPGNCASNEHNRLSILQILTTKVRGREWTMK